MPSVKTSSAVLPCETNANQTQVFSAWAASDTLLDARFALPSVKPRESIASSLARLVVLTSRVSTMVPLTLEQLEITPTTTPTKQPLDLRPISHLSGNPALSSISSTATLLKRATFLSCILYLFVSKNNKIVFLKPLVFSFHPKNIDIKMPLKTSDFSRKSDFYPSWKR